MKPILRALLVLLFLGVLTRGEDAPFGFVQIGGTYRITCAENIKLPTTFKVVAKSGGGWLQIEYAPKLLYVLPADGAPHATPPPRTQVKRMWINLNQVAGIEEATE